jgi:hypothetical protein
MPLEQVLEWIRRRPFMPFRLCITDGASIEVPHPDIIVPGARSVMVGIPGPNLPEGVVDRFAVVALVHITRLEPLDAAVAP